MGSPDESPLTGRCACSHVRYILSSSPLIVHACHCTYCQRETGTSFALNALYEPDRVHTKLSTGESGEEAEARLLRKGIPTATSGPEGQVIVRCPECFTVLWSHYSGTTRSLLKIVRVGTIDGLVDGERWFDIPEGDVVFEEYGPMEEYWPKESLERYRAFSDRVQAKEPGK
ncbi:aldehyde-activating protein [Colletotrichum asianum]